MWMTPNLLTFPLHFSLLMILRAYSLPLDLSVHSRTTAKFPSPKVLPTLYLSAMEAGTDGYSSISSAGEQNKTRLTAQNCFRVQLRTGSIDSVSPSLPSPSPSSMELQTFVEAKESEEPLCWDPWRRHTAKTWGRKDTDALVLLTSETVELVKIATAASKHKAYLCCCRPRLDNKSSALVWLVNIYTISKAGMWFLKVLRETTILQRGHSTNLNTPLD